MKQFIQTAYTSVLSLSFRETVTDISTAEAPKPLTDLSLVKDDRILILIPHPDDEVIGYAGIIQAAARTGAELKVLYLTDGEHNPISLVAYKKRIFFKDKRQAFIELGKVRKRESIEAMDTLGVDETRLMFLGYPDLGIRPIFIEHWGQDNEYRDSLTGLHQVQEGGGITPNGLYTGEAILNDVTWVIREFRPTKIFCSHPLDRHSDHVGLYLFLKVALWELRDEITAPETYLCVVHYRRWPSPRGFHPDKMLFPPERLDSLNLNWFIFKLNPVRIERKRRALMKFQSQIKYSRNYLLSFVRANEVFSQDLKEIYLGNGLSYILEGEGKIKNISFHHEDDALAIDINFLKRMSKARDIKGTLYLFGCRNKKAFKDMPKVKIGFRSNRWCAYNRKHKIGKAEISFSLKPDGLHFRIPLALLGSPDLILYSLRSNLSGTKINGWGCWRMLNLKP